MEINTIAQMVGSLGFPIVVAGYMIYVNKQQTEAHKTEIKEMTEAINELKIVIQSLLDKIGG